MAVAMNRGTIALTDGTTLTYREAGHGPPLVLLPGAYDDGGRLETSVARLGDAYTVFAPDLPGLGHRAAQGLQELLLSRDIRDATVVTDSVGAPTLREHLDRYGSERIARVILTGSGGAWAGLAGRLPTLVCEDGQWPDGLTRLLGESGSGSG